MTKAPAVIGVKRYSGAIVQVKPGDLLFHPTTGKPLTKVIKSRTTTTEAAGKPNRYVINIEAEDLP